MLTLFLRRSMLTLASLAIGEAGAGAADAVDPIAIARRHLAQTSGVSHGLSSVEVANMTVARHYLTPATNLTTLWLQQTVGGLPVEGAVVRFAIDDRGQVLWAHADQLAPRIKVIGAHAIGAESAIVAAARELGLDLGGDVEPVTSLAGSHLAYVAPNLAQPARVDPLVLRSGRPGWSIVLDQARPTAMWAVRVDALSGAIVFRRDLVRSVPDGLVFAGPYPDTVPGGVAQTIESFGTTPESPNGWLFAAADPRAPESVGNNAEAREDWTRDNEVPLGAPADGGAVQQFRFPFTDSWAIAGDFKANTDAAITNVFYWANRWHDMTYALGFDEAAGNAQFDNFGRGGQEGDALRLDVQDGAEPVTGAPSYNNANMATPIDGMRPRLQLFLWVQGAMFDPVADSAFDADIILHELTHTALYRLVGGPPGLYAPATFLRELTASAALALATGDLDDGGWRDEVARSHRGRLTGADPVVAAAQAELDSELGSDKLMGLRAGRLAVTKSYVERPVTRDLLGPVPTSVRLEDSPALTALARRYEDAARLHPRSLALMRAKTAVDPFAFTRMVALFEATVAADTARNEHLVRRPIHHWFAGRSVSANRASLNQRVYAELFHTPASDPWLGLLRADVYSAVDGGGISGEVARGSRREGRARP